MITQNQFISEAKRILDTIGQTPEERKRYEWCRKSLLDYNTNMRGSHQEGLEEGLQKGREEVQELALHKVAKSMLKQNLPIETIVLTTGLS
ncbi:MAG: hypothetical protein V4629_08090 [Pseudomonadota bacterium]